MLNNDSCLSCVVLLFDNGKDVSPTSKAREESKSDTDIDRAASKDDADTAKGEQSPPRDAPTKNAETDSKEAGSKEIVPLGEDAISDCKEVSPEITTEADSKEQIEGEATSIPVSKVETGPHENPQALKTEAVSKATAKAGDRGMKSVSFGADDMAQFEKDLPVNTSIFL
jgi:hypothetical protein